MKTVLLLAEAEPSLLAMERWVCPVRRSPGAMLQARAACALRGVLTIEWHAQRMRTTDKT
jgi:hypothetical protein